LAPYSAKNRSGVDVVGIQKLTIIATSGSQSDRAEILLNLP
jgi:hypothetical protein